MQHAARIDYHARVPKIAKAFIQAHGAIAAGSIKAPLIDYVYLRVSQLNGCGYCVDLHFRNLVKLGVEPRVINAVAGWREAPFFGPRERAALAWAEIVTRMPLEGVDDADYAAVRAELDEDALAELTAAIAMMNLWNRMNVAFRLPMAP